MITVKPLIPDKLWSVFAHDHFIGMIVMRDASFRHPYAAAVDSTYLGHAKTFDKAVELFFTATGTGDPNEKL